MKEITITINESDIAERIAAVSGYAAMARTKAGIPERFTDMMQTTGDDRTIVQGFITESIDEAAGIISRFMSPCTVSFIDVDDERLIRIAVTLPHNYPVSTIESLRMSITEFAAYRSLQQWMLTVKPDESSLYGTKADNVMVRMRSLLATRVRPEKSPDNNDNIIEL